jgi:hypothetical protein
MTRARRNSINLVIGLAGILAAYLVPTVAHADTILTGVDYVHPSLFSIADQNAALAQMKTAGVPVIRFGMEDKEDENLDFIERAHAQNIRIVLIFHGKYSPGTPVRPYRPKEFPGMWQGPPISSLDPSLSRIYFQQFMDKLDAAGIALAGIELENEINMAGNNPDFRLPGEGRVLGLDDLYHDPEGQQVAKGYLQYLKVLAAMKDVRDHSKLSGRTPLLPTSLVDTGPEGAWPTPKNYDGVSPGATMAFFRANGVDKLVDAYNLHIYPWADGPGEKVSAVHRLRRLLQLVLPLCSPPGASSGKPCWVTEWGFTNDSKSCPSDEKARSLLVQEMMGDFQQLAQEKRLTGLIYYSWLGEARFDVFRCGSLARTGQLAIAPMPTH